MAAKAVLVLAVSLLTVAMAASACSSDYPPAPRLTPTPSTGSLSSLCDALKLRVCTNVLGLCCSLLDGLLPCRSRRPPPPPLTPRPGGLLPSCRSAHPERRREEKSERERGGRRESRRGGEREREDDDVAY